MVVFCRSCGVHSTPSSRFHYQSKQTKPCYACPDGNTPGCKKWAAGIGEIPGAPLARMPPEPDLIYIDLEAGYDPESKADVFFVSWKRMHAPRALEREFENVGLDIDDCLKDVPGGVRTVRAPPAAAATSSFLRKPVSATAGVMWRFPIEQYQPALAVLRKQVRCCIDPIPPYIFDYQDQRAKEGRKDGGDCVIGGGGTALLKEDDCTLTPVSKGRFSASGNWRPPSVTPLRKFDHSDPMYDQLKDFQKKGVSFIVSLGGRGIIADEMGLGKSCQACTVAHHYREEWPVLIACPSSLCSNWSREFSKWCVVPESRILVLHAASTRGKKNVLSQEELDSGSIAAVICGYNNLEKNVKHLRFKVVIMDESHFIKNQKTTRATVAIGLGEKAQRLVLLSGTPAMSRPAELFTQLRLVKKAHFPSFNTYATRYCAGHYSFFGHKAIDALGCSHLKELNYLVRTVMVRRLKSEVLGELPDKGRDVVYLEISEADRKKLKPALDSLQTTIEAAQEQAQRAMEAGNVENLDMTQDVAPSNVTIPGGPRGAGGGGTLDLKIRTAQAKANEVCNYLKDYLESVGITGGDKSAVNEFGNNHEDGGEDGHDDDFKFIIFAHHQYMLDKIEELISKTKIIKPDGKTGFLQCIRVDGHMNMQEREREMDRFRTQKQVRCAILGIDSCGTGHNLTCASTVIFAELAWNPSSHLQAEDRVHRIGQVNKCNIIYLLAMGTADDLLWPLLQTKFQVTSQLLAKSMLDDKDITLVPGAAAAPKNTNNESQQKSLNNINNSGGGNHTSASNNGCSTAGGGGMKQPTLDNFLVKRPPQMVAPPPVVRVHSQQHNDNSPHIKQPTGKAKRLDLHSMERTGFITIEESHSNSSSLAILDRSPGSGSVKAVSPPKRTLFRPLNSNPLPAGGGGGPQPVPLPIPPPQQRQGDGTNSTTPAVPVAVPPPLVIPASPQRVASAPAHVAPIPPPQPQQQRPLVLPPHPVAVQKSVVVPPPVRLVQPAPVVTVPSQPSGTGAPSSVPPPQPIPTVPPSECAETVVAPPPPPPPVAVQQPQTSHHMPVSVPKYVGNNPKRTLFVPPGARSYDPSAAPPTVMPVPVGVPPVQPAAVHVQAVAPPPPPPVIPPPQQLSAAMPAPVGPVPIPAVPITTTTTTTTVPPPIPPPVPVVPQQLPVPNARGPQPVPLQPSVQPPPPPLPPNRALFENPHGNNLGQKRDRTE